MSSFRNISIKYKLMLMIMAASMVAVLLVAGGFVTYEDITFRTQMKQELSTLAEIVGNESTSALSFDDQDRGAEILGGLKAEKHVIAAAFYKEDGTLFATYPAHSNVLVPATPEPNTSRFEKDGLILFHEIRLKGGLAGTIYLKKDLVEMNERMARYGTLVLLIMGAAGILIYFLSSMLQGIISRPISHLAQTARTVSKEKNYSIRATKHGGDETGLLIDGFNEMLGEIQKRDGALQEANDELEKRVEARTHDLRLEIAERKRAEDSLQQQFARISLLNQITQAISERQDTDSILHVVLRQLEDHLGLDFGCVALFDAAANTFNVSALRIKNPALAGRIDFNEGSVLPFAETGFEPCKNGQTIYMRDTLKTPGQLTEKLAVAGWRSAVVVPLIVDEKLFGVMLTARLKADSFNSGDGEFLRMLSEHVALAAHQAKLHTELSRAYDELRQTQQTVMQQERLKALGQMASGIAHDVNNALSPVVGFADLILMGEHGLSANGKKYLNHIQTAGQDIAHIVARLREFYRTRDEDESLQKLNLNALTEQVIDMLRPRWRDMPQSRGITIEMETHLAPDMMNMVGIESEIREAITNLILNAVDALPTGGKISIRSRVLRTDPAAGNVKHPTQLILEVSDTGTGMSEETRRRCLEPFFSTKGKRGTGLGLAMVYGVMERHEGSIEIDSELGKGTTFRLMIPLRKLSETVGLPEESKVPIRPLQILCIDDEPLLRELLKEILERDGHCVEVSDGGQSGLDAFRLASREQHPFDIVITDLGMPYLDGREVARTLKQEFPGTPIIMLTGWGAFMKEEDSLPQQVDSILSKPPRSREIRETLRRLTNQNGVHKN